MLAQRGASGQNEVGQIIRRGRVRDRVVVDGDGCIRACNGSGRCQRSKNHGATDHPWSGSAITSIQHQAEWQTEALGRNAAASGQRNFLVYVDVLCCANAHVSVGRRHGAQQVYVAPGA